MAWWEYAISFLAFLATWSMLLSRASDFDVIELSKRVYHLENADDARKLLVEAATYDVCGFVYQNGQFVDRSIPFGCSYTFSEFRIFLKEHKLKYFEKQLTECCPKGKKK